MNAYIMSSCADLVICVYEDRVDFVSANKNHTISNGENAAFKIYKYILNHFDA